MIDITQVMMVDACFQRLTCQHNTGIQNSEFLFLQESLTCFE